MQKPKNASKIKQALEALRKLDAESLKELIRILNESLTYRVK